jgi:hypothetical protein
MSSKDNFIIDTSTLSDDTINVEFFDNIKDDITVNIDYANSLIDHDNTITITSDTLATVLHAYNITIDSLGTEWIDRFPFLDDVLEMKKEYPALEKSFENFQMVYKMVKQDWDGKLKERNS